MRQSYKKIIIFVREFHLVSDDKQNFMLKKNINIEIEVLDPNELSREDFELVEAAKGMTKNSYAPYSQFHVGAAIRLENNLIVKGSNQENAAYPSGICAERTACWAASANYPGVPMKKIAIAAWTKLHKPEDLSEDDYFQDEPISPCGACRQALLEYENLYGPMELLLYGRKHIYRVVSVSALLPLSFTEF